MSAGRLLFASAVLLQSGCVPVTEVATAAVPDPITRTFLLDCDSAGTRLVCVGERGLIALSDDHGVHWRRAHTPPARLLTAVDFRDAQHGWAVGHDGVILSSDDGGEAWRVQHRLADENMSLFDVLFSDERHGIAVGSFGVYAMTADGGRSWTQHRVGDQDPHLYALARTPAGTLFVAGEAGTLLRSDDGGAQWRALPSPFEGAVFGIVATPPANLIVYGMLGTWAQSPDNGESWRSAQLATRASIQAADLSNPDAPLLASVDGQLWIGTRAVAVARDIGAAAHLRRLPDGQLLVTRLEGIKRLALPAAARATPAPP